MLELSQLLAVVHNVEHKVGNTDGGAKTCVSPFNFGGDKTFLVLPLHFKLVSTSVNDLAIVISANYSQLSSYMFCSAFL